MLKGFINCVSGQESVAEASDNVFESHFEGCPLKGAESIELAVAYNEYSNYHGFRVRRNGYNKKLLHLNCIVGRDQPSRYCKGPQDWKKNKIVT